MTFIIKIVLYALVIIGTAYLIPGIDVTGGFWPTAVLVGLGFALVNAIIRAIFSGNIIFGIIAIVLNAVAFWFIGMYVSGFGVATYVAALLGSIVASFGVWLINEMF